MYWRTADAGDPYALGLAAGLLEDAGRLNEAIGLSQAHAKAGPAFHRWRAAVLLSDAAARMRPSSGCRASPKEPATMGPGDRWQS